MDTPSAEGTTLRRLGAAALLMTGAVFASRVIGYLREAYVAARFGANAHTDAFYAAFTIPDWLNHLVAGGTLSITFLPIYAHHLAKGDEREANRVLSIVATVMMVVLALGVLAGELFARPLTAAYLKTSDPAAFDACVRYTRILLPAQVCFFAGGLASATLFARGRFAAAALAPLLYNAGIIAGGVALGGALGPEGLVWGALAGAFVGPFLIPAVDAWRKGARVRPSFALRHPGLVEWVKLSLPLMIGVSVISADDWLIRYFAAADAGEITRLTYAKRLVAVPIAVAGQAVGQASMPFFARLFAEGKREELARTFARTARSAGVVSAMIAAWMIALAAPLIDVLFRRGRFDAADVPPTAVYLAIFAAAVPLWSLQGLAARVFYAAKNTLSPMIAGTLVTLVSLPLYALAWRQAGATGLAIASGAGILLQAAALIALAPRVLPEARAAVAGELRALAAGFLLAALAGGAAWGVARVLLPLAGGRFGMGHLASLTVGAIASAAFAVVVLVLARPLGVDEPRALWRKLARRPR